MLVSSFYVGHLLLSIMALVVRIPRETLLEKTCFVLFFFPEVICWRECLNQAWEPVFNSSRHVGPVHVPKVLMSSYMYQSHCVQKAMFPWCLPSFWIIGFLELLVEGFNEDIPFMIDCSQVPNSLLVVLLQAL